MHSVVFVIVDPEEQDVSPFCSTNIVPGASVGACVVATKIYAYIHISEIYSCLLYIFIVECIFPLDWLTWACIT